MHSILCNIVSRDKGRIIIFFTNKCLIAKDICGYPVTY